MDLEQTRLARYKQRVRHPWEEARKVVILDLLKKYAPEVFSQPCTILEVGCGDTWLIRELSKELPKATFLTVDAEYNEEKLLFYKETLKGVPVNVYDTLETALQDTENNVDVVLVADVLEHLADDTGFIRWLLTYEKIESANWLFTTPAFSFLYGRHDKSRNNLRRYTTKSLESVLNRGGLQNVGTGYFFFTLFLIRLVGRIFPLKEGAKFSSGVFKLIKYILLTDYFFFSVFDFLKVKVPGSSCYMVGKKE